MLQGSIGWILVVSGAVTALAGLAAALFTVPLLRLAFGVANPEAATRFFSRHWGLLIFLVGALLIESASAPALRNPVLIVAAIEKWAIVLLVFFGPLKRTLPMTAIALGDGLFALLYVAYLAGL